MTTLLAVGMSVLAPARFAAAAAALGTDLYGTPNTAPFDTVYLVDKDSGAESAAVTLPAGLTTTVTNQLGIDATGEHMILTNATNVFEYTASTESWVTTARSTGPTVPNTHGGINKATGDYFYGGFDATLGKFVFASYNPDTNTIRPQTLTVTVPGTVPGGNGDLAFDYYGNMYIVAGGATTAQVYRVNAADVLKATATGVPVGDLLDTGTTVNSMAFGFDGYLYVQGTVTGGGGSLRQLNPITGDQVPPNLTLTQGLTDLASRTLPSTGESTVSLPNKHDDNDQVTLTITGNGVTTNNTATTSGTNSTATVGPILLLPGGEQTVTQSAGPNTSLDDYNTTWTCTDNRTGSVVTSGTGNVATYTVPSDGGDVNCAFTNVPKAAPNAENDADRNNVIGDPVTVDVLNNDTGETLVPGSVGIVPPGGGAPVTTLTVDGQGSWSVNQTTGAITFTPVDGFEGDPTPITYRVSDDRGNNATATVTVTYAPQAVNDKSTGNTIGSPVGVAVLANDLGDIDPATVGIVPPGGGTPVTTLTVDGEGTWRVNTDTGRITFTPVDGFEGDPTPITYQIANPGGATDTATVTIAYAPQANNDLDTGNAVGQPARIDVLANDAGDFDPSTVRIVPPGGGTPVTTLAVDGQGTWTVNTTTGVITFTPEDGYLGDPTPVGYQVEGNGGVSVGATVTVRYNPVARNDTAPGGTLGQPVTVPVLDNDLGDVQPGSVVIVPPGGGTPVTSLAVDGQGTWRVDPTTGAITFTPVDAYTGNPTPITYRVSDAGGDTDTATVTITYTPRAVADANRNNSIGDPVEVDVLANDQGTLDPSTVRIVDADGSNPVTTLTVPGEGVWSVNQTTGAITFTPADDFTGNPTAISYVVGDGNGLTSAPAAVTVTYSPQAKPDADLDNAQGSTVAVDVLANDLGDLDPSTVRIVDADGGNPVTTLTVAGQGTWTVNTTTGVISFAPADGFSGNPTPIDYVVTDRAGQTTDPASVRVTYAPGAVDDTSPANPIGQPVTVPVLDNDLGALDPTSVVIVPPGGGTPVTSLTVDGQGTWTVDPATGAITFTPADGYTGNPDPITYQVSDEDDNTTQATVTVGFQPVANDDSDLNNAQGATVVVNVLANDQGALDPTSVVILTGGNGTPVTSLTVEGEGTWRVNQTTGAITFTPADGYTGNPTPITYRVSDDRGLSVTATVTVTYAVAAVDDADLDNTINDSVVVDVLANDQGDLDTTSVQIVLPGGQLGRQFVVAGQGSWTVDETTGAITFAPADGFTGNPTPITYRVSDNAGNTSTAEVTITYRGQVNDDEDLNNAQGSTVTVDVLANDRGLADPPSVGIVPTGGGSPVSTLTVKGEGTWTVDAGTGAISFTPADGFTANPTPITYRVTDQSGNALEADVRVTYLPQAVNDAKQNNRFGDAVTVPVLANDKGALDPSTVRIVNADGSNPVTTLTVDGQGTWTVNATTGAITFTPVAGFYGDPTPITYRVSDVNKNTTTATVTIGYVAKAVNDADLHHTIGDAVTVAVLANDRGQFDPTTVKIVSPDGGALVTSLMVAGEGTWTVDPTSGAITFAPASGFTGDPTPITYQVDTLAGQTVSAKVTVGYDPDAVPDVSTGNTPGTPVTVDVLGNDRGDVDPSTVVIIGPGGQQTDTLVVPGEGTWTVDPTTGDITFTPEQGFTGDPTPITYQVGTRDGGTATATVTITYERTPTTPSPSASPTPGGQSSTSASPAPGVQATTGVNPTTSGGSLASTGAPSGWPLLAAFGALLAGVGLVLIRRRNAGKHSGRRAGR